jgi:hypothetical protein
MVVNQVIKKVPSSVRSIILAVALSAVLISTAYLAAGAVHDRIIPEVEEEFVAVTIEEIDTDGLGGTSEHPHIPTEVVEGIAYDLGVRVLGLEDKDGVVVYFSIARDGISVDDVECYYFDTVSSSWRPLYFVDQGDTLRATLGPTAGTDIYDGYERMYRLIVSFGFDGECQEDCWVNAG